MRLMMIMSLVLASLTVSANEMVARKFSFTYFGNDIGSRTIYSCDSAEDIMRERLQDLGAQNIRVSCSGGLDTWNTGRDPWNTGRWGRGDFGTPVNLTARFNVPASRDNAQRMVIRSERFNTNCDFNVQLLGRLLKNLPNARLVSKRSSCRGAEGSYSFTADVAL